MLNLYVEWHGSCSSIKQKEDFRMFASKLFRKAAIAGLAAALFCAPAQSFAKETVKVGFIGCFIYH